MQLLQIRGFNEFFQDTFAYLKQNGKHYFKHYFIINGFLLLLLAAMTYLFVTFFATNITNPFLGVNDGNSTLDNFINDNFGVFILGASAFIIIALLAGIVSYAYTPIYLKLYNDHNGTHFSTKEIVATYKANIGRLLSFVLLGILVAIPIMIVAGIASFVLMITIVGFLLLPLVIGFVALLYNSTLLEYIHHRRNYWDAMGYSWNLITSKFWHAVGCVGIFYVIAYVIQFSIQIVSSIFTTARSLTVLDDNSNSGFDMPLSVIIVMASLFILQFIVSIITNSIVQINQGIIYFSLKEEKENINTKGVIDQIGLGEE